MERNLVLKTLGISVFLMAAAMSIGFVAGVGEGKLPQFKITSKRDNDKIEVKNERDKTLFLVHSPFGISEAVVERTAEKWPENVVLRFHLKGLSKFSASNGKLTLNLSASIEETRLWKDREEESPLDNKSPYWIEVRIVGDDGKPAKEIPLEGGYFELKMPKAFFNDNPKSITVNWIDFYRN